jgi:hypothetical protein
VRGVTIRLRVHSDGTNTQTPARAEDAAGNLAAVGDEHSAEH